MNLRIYITFFISLGLVISGYAQKQEKDKLLRDFEKQFIVMNYLIFKDNNNSKNSTRNQYFIHKDSLALKSDSLLNKTLDQKEKAEISAINSTSGLQLLTNASYRFDNGITINQDEEDFVSQYKIKFQAELSWNLFQSALFRNKIKKQIVHLNREVDYINSKNISLQNFILNRRKEVGAMYDSLLVGVLHHHIANLDLLEKAELVLLANEQSSSDKLLKVIEEKTEAERLLSLIYKDYKPAESLTIIPYNKIEIDSVSLLNAIKNENNELKLFQLRKEILNNEIKKTDYWEDVSVSPYVRYSGYHKDNARLSSVIDAGVSIKLPLSAESYKKRNIIKAERQLLEINLGQTENLTQETAVKILRDIEKLDNALYSEYERLKALHNLLAIRKKAYDNRKGEYDRPARIREYNIYLLSLEKIYTFKRQQELLLLDMQVLLSNIPMSNFIKNRKFTTKIIGL